MEVCALPGLRIETWGTQAFGVAQTWTLYFFEEIEMWLTHRLPLLARLTGTGSESSLPVPEGKAIRGGRIQGVQGTPTRIPL
jgi:hypothetical protein